MTLEERLLSEILHLNSEEDWKFFASNVPKWIRNLNSEEDWKISVIDKKERGSSLKLRRGLKVT